jgi:hypothetical protein
MSETLLPPLPGATEITTSTGVVLWVNPMTLADQQNLRKAGRKQYPEPNPQDFATAIADDEALFPGQQGSGEQTDAFAVAKAEHEALISEYITDMFFAGFVDSPMGRDNLVKIYARVVEMKRGIVPMPTNEWAATLKHAILLTVQDVGAVVRAGHTLLPLTGGEIADGIRIFRLQNEQKPPRQVSNGRVKTPKPAPETQASPV